jgi:lipopolysaccharide/colanic/teichoic acid biosynthesis glycosyltransferase
LYQSSKRLLDILVAITAIILLSPVFIIVSIALMLTGEHEVFYYQKRVGFKNKPFYIWKFATMLKNSPNMGTKEITLRNDPRVTALGRFLRKSKINELPQIINVLRGDMSIVGPRPLMEVSFKLYSEEVQQVIYRNRPGITGLGSLVFRDEEKLVSQAADPKAYYAEMYSYKGALEMWYYENASMLTDITLIFLTAASLFDSDSNMAYKAFHGLPKPFELETATLAKKVA